MITLQSSGLCKSLAGKTILENINMTLQEGEKVGLVGANGSGKTTLLKCLAGILEVEQGSVAIGKHQRLGFMEQLPLRNPEETVWDAMMSSFDDLLELRQRLAEFEFAISSGSGDVDVLLKQYSVLQDEYHDRNGYACETMARRILAGLGIDPCQYNLTLKVLSGGQKTRLDLARLLAGQPDLLLLDEPTNHLDIDAVEWLEGYLEDYGGTVLVVSHDRRFLDRVVNRILELRGHKLRSFQGNYSAYLVKAEAQDQAQAKAFAKQQEQIQATEAYIERYRSGIKARQARGRQAQLNRLQRIDKPARKAGQAEWRLLGQQSSGETVIELQGLGKGYNGEGLFMELDLLIRRGERVALLGPNGCGKTTLLKIITGELTPDQGTVRLGSRVKPGYFSQGYENLDEERTLLDEMVYGCNLNLQQGRDMLALMRFTGDTVHQRVGELSGGEKGRLAVLKLISGGANLLLLDEPTNHLDIASRQAMEEMLAGYDGTILLVSHDRYFIDAIAERILVFEGRRLKSYAGNYSYYREKVLASGGKPDSVQTATASSQQQFRMQQKEQQRRKRRLERQLLELEQFIEELEQQRSELADILADPATYQDQAVVTQYIKELEEIEKRILASYQDWAISQETWEELNDNGGEEE
ncbi:MAG: ABC-F family ATP-binding cassette domain-containing protein [Syntrophomonadaceae bacterium]|jgi:ATP-binding cassette subfamily F protein 3